MCTIMPKDSAWIQKKNNKANIQYCSPPVSPNLSIIHAKQDTIVPHMTQVCMSHYAAV